MKNTLLVFFTALCFSVSGQVPKTINFQGYLTDPSGAAVDAPSPGLSITFSLWDASTGGSKLWEEAWNGVIVTKGLYNVNLGESTAINLPFDKIYYLEVKVGLQTLSPRITLTSNAYSISSINASNISTGTLNGALVGSGINASNITTNNLAVSNGGTGASTTAAARTSLGVAIGSDVQAYDADLDDLSDGSLSGTKLDITAGSNIILTPVGNSLQISTGGSALSGSGSSGQLAYWNGPGSFSSDGNLVWDNTNKRLGLGVSSPTQKLDVSGTVNATAFAGNGAGITSISASNITSGTLADARLATISTSGKVANSATTATSTNTGSTIVARDGSGNFSAGTITAALNGNASTVTTNANLTGDITSVGNTTTIASGVIVNADINGSAAIADSKLATISSSGKVANSATTATNTNTASTIVARDGSGNFSAGTITANLSGNASTVTTNANLTGDVTSVGNATSIASGVIVDSDINSGAGIVDTKLATISTAGKVSGSAITSGTIGGSTAMNTSGTITSSSYVGATGGMHVGNTTAPATSGNLEVDGYAKLGGSGVSVSTSVPAGATVSFPTIRIMKMTGTTAAADGTATITLSGLTSAKILSIQILVDYSGSGDYVPPGFTSPANLQFNFNYQGGILFIRNATGNSATIGGRAFKAVIIYEQ